MSKTLTMRAMKLRMVLKLMRPMLQEPSTSSTMSALAEVLHCVSAERRGRRAVRRRVVRLRHPPWWLLERSEWKRWEEALKRKSRSTSQPVTGLCNSENTLCNSCHFWINCFLFWAFWSVNLLADRDCPLQQESLTLIYDASCSTDFLLIAAPGTWKISACPLFWDGSRQNHLSPSDWRPQFVWVIPPPVNNMLKCPSDFH